MIIWGYSVSTHREPQAVKFKVQNVNTARNNSNFTTTINNGSKGTIHNSKIESKSISVDWVDL